jgi:hypothetical protein
VSSMHRNEEAGRSGPSRHRTLRHNVLLVIVASAAAVVAIVGTTSGALSRQSNRRPSRSGGHGRSSHRIVVGRGIAGVQLGDSRQTVATILGNPSAVAPPYWEYHSPLKGRVALEQDKVTDIWTQATAEKTTRGIGPGTSVLRLRRAYPETRCYTAPHKTEAICVLRASNHRRSVETDFLILRHVVRTVEIRSIAVPAQGTRIVLAK